jgi:hypothetical protein
MATKVSRLARLQADQKTVDRRFCAARLRFASIKALIGSEITRAFMQPERQQNKALEDLQVMYDDLRAEVERLTADLVATRKRLRAERYRTRRLVDMVSNLEQLQNRPKKSTPALELGESAEALAVFLAQQRFKSQSRVH